MHIGRHGAFAKCSTYFCLVIPSHTQWLISSLQERKREGLKAVWNKIIWDNLPSPIYVTKRPHLLQVLYFLQAVSSSNSATLILGSQDEVFNRFSFPPLHVFCVSACIKAVEKKQHCPVSIRVFRPWHKDIKRLYRNSLLKVKTFLLILKVKPDRN